MSEVLQISIVAISTFSFFVGILIGWQIGRGF